MTRKEVCDALGITVKTLRLYEEKGLIVPEKEYRNGREYRNYSPELERQLERIVILRRALFTMDEIKLMQSQPEKIPEVFHDYQIWLDQQTQQFQQLKAAAAMVRESSLGSIDGLIGGLKSTAVKMPLPQMDVKPNFRRLDEMEELPRHVEKQVDFDETVPSARVFRQMNLAMDGDKANNINVAFGQYNELKKGIDREATGPVQKEIKSPLWFKILSLMATVLLLISAILVIMDHRQGRLWIFMFVMVVIRVVLAQLPTVLDHRKWVRENARASREEVQRERKRRRLIVSLCCLGLASAVGLTYLLYRVIDAQMNPDRDYQVLFATPAYIADSDIAEMRQVISPLVGDLDGNGNLYTAVDVFEVSRGGWAYGDKSTYREGVPIEAVVGDGEYTLCFLSNITYSDFNICRDFQFYQYCQVLPEDLQVKGKEYCVDLTGAALFSAAGLGDLPVYGCISAAATEEEYDMAVELIRKLLEQN